MHSISKTELRWLWRQTQGTRWAVVGVMALGLLRIALSMGFVYACKYAVDIATGSAMGELSHSLILLVSLMALQLLSQAAATYVREMSSIRFTNRLRRRLFDQVLLADWQGRKAFHSADMVNRLEEDIRVIASLILSDVPSACLSCFQLLASSYVLYTLQPSLLWVLLVIMPIALLVSKIYFRLLRQLTKDIRQQDSRIQGHMQENMQNRSLILTMGHQNETSMQMGALQDTLIGLTRQRLRYSIRARVFVQAGFMAGYVLTFCWGVYGIMAGAVTYGMMTAFLQLVGQVQQPVVNLSHQLTSVATSLTSIERLREISILSAETQGEPQMLDGQLGIRVRNLDYTYPDEANRTISKLSADFLPGSSTAIMGETGAGKSTLLRILLALIHPEDGSVEIYNDHQSLPISPATRCNFMYVPQGNSLLSGTIRDNLLLGNPEATDEDMWRALDTACAGFVRELPEGLLTPCSEKGNGLSEGQAQRIAIARALLHPGSIMLLDEACSAVDPDTEAQIIANLTEATRGRKTVLWVTHHPSISAHLDHKLLIGE